jgi:septal ring factor EnvC (AmiA/AmiB activator)
MAQASSQALLYREVVSGSKRIAYALALLLLAGASGAYLVHRGPWERLDGLRESQKQVDALERERTLLEQRRDRLQRRVEGLKSDPVEVEASIRRSKGLIREGERIYRIPLPGDTPAPDTP